MAQRRPPRDRAIRYPRGGIAFARRARLLVAKLPAAGATTKLEVRLQTALGAALRATKGFASPSVVAAFERAKTLCAHLDDDDLLLDLLPGLQSYFHVHGHLRTARELAEQLVALTHGRPNEPYRSTDAHRRLGWSLFWLGELAAAGRYLEEALALYNPREHMLHIRLYGDHPGVFSHCNLAWVRWSQGKIDEADQHAETALKLADESGHVLSVAYSLCVLGALYAARGDPDLAIRLAVQAIPFAEEKGFPYWTAWAHIIHGWAVSMLGEAEQGAAELTRGIDDYVATGGELVRPYALGLLAEVLILLGQNERAAAVADEAFRRAQDKDIQFYTSELRRLRGCALLAAGTDIEQGTTCLREAVRIAARQGAYSLELRASTALARASRSVPMRVAAL